LDCEGFVVLDITRPGTGNTKGCEAGGFHGFSEGVGGRRIPPQGFGSGSEEEQDSKALPRFQPRPICFERSMASGKARRHRIQIHWFRSRSSHMRQAVYSGSATIWMPHIHVDAPVRANDASGNWPRHVMFSPMDSAKSEMEGVASQEIARRMTQRSQVWGKAEM
jgi:hypothetical protein